MSDIELLLENLPELPPDDVVDQVTPWNKAMKRILTGFALTSITLNFWYLNYILPTVGMMLILLGFRTLRKENRYFGCCYILSVVRFILLAVTLVMNTTIIFRRSDMTCAIINGVALLIIYVCFRNGLKVLQIKADIPVNVKNATGLTVWYVVLFLLALVEYKGYLISLIMLVLYALILRSLYKTSKEIGEAGYAVTASRVIMTDTAIVLTAVSLIAVSAFFGYTFGCSHPMDWKPLQNSSQQRIERIKTDLLNLGFPEQILKDLSIEDISACEGAVSVVVDSRDFPINKGREVSEYKIGENGEGWYIDTVYDVKELRLTGIAVKLPSDRETWKLFHHFSWIAPHSKSGTESIQLWPAYRDYSGWFPSGEVSGQVLCDIDGETYVSDYYFLENKTYTSQSIFFGERTSTDIFAEFSMNKKGENHRGYVSYSISVSKEGHIIDSWINYTHQKHLLQYPAKTAAEERMTSGFSNRGAFITVQDALQMHDGKNIS